MSDDHTDALTPVSRTALGVARIRAAESRRVDRLFDDPWAEAFVAAMPDAYAAEAARGAAPDEVRRRLVQQVSLRTRFYDDVLLDACAAGVRQVVLVAAGLDARALRLPWPPRTQVFEVDLPEVLAFKDRVLRERRGEPRCRRTVVAADLTQEWTGHLRGAGHRGAEPTAWLIEGLLVYLDVPAVERLLSAVTAESAAGSRLACERSGPRSVARLQKLAAEHAAVSLWRGGLGADVETWLREHGWSTAVHDVADVARDLGRPIPADGDSGFVVAQRNTN